MNIWLLSSSNIDNIKIAKDRLLWGFWDRDAGKKMRKNWRSFIRLYNKIEPFDLAIFQIAKNGYIHGIGVVKNTYYDDQTPVWPNEITKGKVLYPWRVEFSIMIFSEDPIITHFISISNYIDGYGLGEVSHHELETVLTAIKENFKIEIKS
ncbi:MAG: hypothetical protein ABIL29_08370 [candidate division WOR-3 bacterium]|nr:hypothetical protein [Thermoproteota archaeon]